MSIKTSIKIRELLKERGIKQKDLASFANVKQTAMANYLTLKPETNRDMPLDVISRVADLLKVDINYLIGYKPINKISGVTDKEIKKITIQTDTLSPTIEKGQVCIVDSNIALEVGDVAICGDVVGKVHTIDTKKNMLILEDNNGLNIMEMGECQRITHVLKEL